MRYTLGEAAKALGISKPTISRAIKNGALSASRLNNGAYSIDPAELERWNSCNRHANPSVKRSVTPKLTHDITPETPKVSPNETNSPPENKPGIFSQVKQRLDELEVDRLRGELKAAELENEFLKQRIRDLTERAERAEKKEDQLYGLLTDQRAKPPAPQEQQRKGFWSRIIGN